MDSIQEYSLLLLLQPIRLRDKDEKIVQYYNKISHGILSSSDHV